MRTSLIRSSTISTASLNRRRYYNLHTQGCLNNIVYSRLLRQNKSYYHSLLKISNIKKLVNYNNLLKMSNFVSESTTAKVEKENEEVEEEEEEKVKKEIPPPIADNLSIIRTRIETAASEIVADTTPRLVAVSKTKPVDLLMEAYNAGQRHFGENYVQEILEKAPQMPEDIIWHFIGHLQSNKAAPLVQAIPNLKVVETVDGQKVCNKLNNACVNVGREDPLGIYIQINTSNEESKSGIATLEDLIVLANHIIDSCPKLELQGLMTIGSPGDLTCFDKLVEYRVNLCKELGGEYSEIKSLQLSMGMSGDFEDAIKRGSTSVRVGSSIFGARQYPPK